MRKRMRMLAAMSLLICAASYGITQPAPDNAKTDNLEKVKMLEQKGDLACIHGDYGAAAYHYQSAIRFARTDAMLYNKLGVVELQLDERGHARKHFAQALKYDPRLIPAVNNLGAVALMNKKYKAAIGYFKQALAMDESIAVTHVNLAEAWVGLREMDRAMTEYTRALELDADVFDRSKEGDFARISTPEQRARISYLIAEAYIKRGNIDGALDFLQRAKDAHYPDLAKVYTDPDFAPLWKDPRLAKIVKR